MKHKYYIVLSKHTHTTCSHSREIQLQRAHTRGVNFGANKPTTTTNPHRHTLLCAHKHYYTRRRPPSSLRRCCVRDIVYIFYVKCVSCVERPCKVCCRVIVCGRPASARSKESDLYGRSSLEVVGRRCVCVFRRAASAASDTASRAQRKHKKDT